MLGAKAHGGHGGHAFAPSDFFENIQDEHSIGKLMEHEKFISVQYVVGMPLTPTMRFDETE